MYDLNHTWIRSFQVEEATQSGFLVEDWHHEGYFALESYPKGEDGFVPEVYCAEGLLDRQGSLQLNRWFSNQLSKYTKLFTPQSLVVVQYILAATWERPMSHYLDCIIRRDRSYIFLLIKLKRLESTWKTCFSHRLETYLETLLPKHPWNAHYHLWT